MSYDPERITFFAKTDARGKYVPFGIKAKDRQRHMYIIGKTGMGKSTILENMAIQDIQNGEGLAFVDPHGSTAEKLLDYVPEHRIKDVLYFAPHDMEYPISFNVMEDVGPDKRHLVVSGLMSTFKKIWVDAWSGRMEYILSNTLLALLEYPDSTLLGVNRMLSDKSYREEVVKNVTDPSVKAFWTEEFAKYNERYMQEAGDAIKNKIGQFTTNPLIRNIIGQPQSSFSIREMMDSRKILIMNLSKGLVGETNANLLGSMLITRIYLAAMSRADLTSAQMEQMPNFYFYVDEFQSFANDTFSNILSEARKYKLNLIIAHQYIEQMDEEVRNAVFGNVGTTVTFRVGPLDAEFLETVFSPQFSATDLVNLGFAQIYLSLMIDGIGSRPFSAVTLPPIEPSHISHRDQIIASSRKLYAGPRDEVEQKIVTWHEPVGSSQNPKRAGEEKKTGEGSRDFPNAGGKGSSGMTAKQQQDQQAGGSSKKDHGAKDKHGAVQHKSANELREVLERLSRDTEQGSESPKAPDTHAQSTPVQKKSDQKNARKKAHTKKDHAKDSKGGAEEKDQGQGAHKKEGAQTQSSASPQDGSKHKEHKKNIKDAQDQNTSNDLKETLRNVVAEHERTHHEKEAAAKDDTEAHDKKDHNKQKTSTRRTPAKESKESKNDEPSKKQLERMLHVNGKERPPLR